MFGIEVSVATVPTHTTARTAIAPASSPIKVAVRIRPDGPNVPGAPHNKYVGGSQCEFHQSFGPTASQSDVFDLAVAPLLTKFASGQNVAVMAYGQTGSGKTHTMGMGASLALGCDESSGVVPRALEWVYSRAPATVTIELVELYNGKINDLIAGEQHVGSAADALALLQTGLRRRQTAATKANAVSSRAHTVITVTVLWPGQLKATKLRLADLADSESQPAHGKIVSAPASATTVYNPSKNASPKTRLCNVIGRGMWALLLACVTGSEADRAKTAKTLSFVKWAGSVKNCKPSGISAGGLGSAAEEAQKRMAAEAEAEQLRATVNQLQITVKQLQRQISAAAQTADTGTDMAMSANVETSTNVAQTADTGTDKDVVQSANAKKYTAMIQSEADGNYTVLVQSGSAKRYTVLVQPGYAATNATGTTTTSAASSTSGYMNLRVLVSKARTSVSAQSASASSDKTACCIKPQKLARKASAKPKSKVSLRAKVRSFLHF